METIGHSTKMRSPEYSKSEQTTVSGPWLMESPIGCDLAYVVASIVVN